MMLVMKLLSCHRLFAGPLFLVVLGSLGLSACGSESTSTPPAPPPAAATTPVAEAPPAVAAGEEKESTDHAGHEHHHDADAAAPDARENLSIEIVEPVADTPAKAGSTVVVAIESEGMDIAGDHWHLYLDGTLQAMVGGGRTRYELSLSKDLSPGPHELKVTISDASHKEFDQASVQTITVLPADSGE